MNRERLLCLNFSELALKACSDGVDLQDCVVVSDQKGRFVKGLSTKASQLGIKIGDSMINAWRLCPELVVVEWNEDCVKQEIQTVLNHLDALTPMAQTIPDHIGYFMLNASGMLLLGGDEALIVKARKIALLMGYSDVRFGFGRQWGVAFLAARTTTREQPVCTINDQDERTFIADVLMSEVVFEPSVLKGLTLLGIDRIGQLNRLPRRTLRSRFGSELEEIFALVDSVDFRTPHVFNKPQSLCVEWVLEQAVWETGHLLVGLRHLCVSLSTRLIQYGCQTTKIHLELVLDNGEKQLENIVTSQAISRAEALFELVRARIENHRLKQLSSGVTYIEISAIDLSSIEGEQVGFTHGRWQKAKTQSLLERLRAHANGPVVYRIAKSSSPIYDQIAFWEPVDERRQYADDDEYGIQRPQLIRRRFPEPQEIPVVINDEKVIDAIFIDERWHQAHLMSRERRSGGWWEPQSYAFEDLCVFTKEYGACWIRYVPNEERWLYMGGWD